MHQTDNIYKYRPNIAHINGGITTKQKYVSISDHNMQAKTIL